MHALVGESPAAEPDIIHGHLARIATQLSGRSGGSGVNDGGEAENRAEIEKRGELHGSRTNDNKRTI